MRNLFLATKLKNSNESWGMKNFFDGQEAFTKSKKK